MSESNPNVMQVKPEKLSIHQKPETLRKLKAPPSPSQPLAQARNSSMNGSPCIQTANNKKNDGPLNNFAHWFLENQTGTSRKPNDKSQLAFLLHHSHLALRCAVALQYLGSP